MAISQTRKASGAFVTVVLLGGVILAFLPVMTATREIRRFCDGLPLGTPVAELQSQAAQRGFRFEPVVGGHILVEHPRSLGRAYCDVGIDAKGQVAKKSADN
jgi:hypothetical protein